MKILIISPYLPHLLSGHGTGVFAYGMLRAISVRHDVTLISFCDEEERLFVEDIRKLPVTVVTIPRKKGVGKDLGGNILLIIKRIWQLIRSIVLWQPYYISKYNMRAMAQCVEKLTRTLQFDIVQIEFAMMAQYGKYVHSGKKILHEHDVSYRPAYRMYCRSRSFIVKLIFLIEWCRWYRYERCIVHAFDHVLTVTEQDRSLLKRLSGAKHISYLSRGVDVSKQISDYNRRERESLIFIGTFLHGPNVDAVIWLLEEILPLIVKKFPKTKLSIIGSSPPDAIRILAACYEGVELPGYVDSIQQYLESKSVFVAPLRMGGGVKLKILHAMAAGIPIVTTKIGSEGIDGISPSNILVGDSPFSIANHVCSLFENTNYASEIGKQGFDLVKKRYSWSNVLEQLEKIYTSS